jgi:hypothetical protein
MSKKNFKIARKPGQGSDSAQAISTFQGEPKKSGNTASAPGSTQFPAASLTTRKTIEVPEDYFFRVKMRALERKMLEKELWAEILSEYFDSHPSA